jgi:hypothetical protein
VVFLSNEKPHLFLNEVLKMLTDFIIKKPKTFSVFQKDESDRKSFGKKI